MKSVFLILDVNRNDHYVHAGQDRAVRMASTSNDNPIITYVDLLIFALNLSCRHIALTPPRSFACILWLGLCKKLMLTSFLGPL